MKVKLEKECINTYQKKIQTHFNVNPNYYYIYV